VLQPGPDAGLLRHLRALLDGLLHGILRTLPHAVRGDLTGLDVLGGEDGGADPLEADLAHLLGLAGDEAGQGRAKLPRHWLALNLLPGFLVNMTVLTESTLVLTLRTLRHGGVEECDGGSVGDLVLR